MTAALPPAERWRGRLPWWRPDELDPGRRALHDEIAGGARAARPQSFALADAKGRLEGPFNALLLDPPVGAAVQGLGTALRFASVLADREREVAILVVAYERASQFEWYAHARVGRDAGLTDEEISALGTGAPCPSLSASETAARRVATALCERRDLDDATFADALATLGEVKIADLVSLVGYYDLLAMSLAVWRTPLPDGCDGAGLAGPGGQHELSAGAPRSPAPDPCATR